MQFLSPSFLLSFKFAFIDKASQGAGRSRLHLGHTCPARAPVTRPPLVPPSPPPLCSLFTLLFITESVLLLAFCPNVCNEDQQITIQVFLKKKNLLLVLSKAIPDQTFHPNQDLGVGSEIQDQFGLVKQLGNPLLEKCADQMELRGGGFEALSKSSGGTITNIRIFVVTCVMWSFKNFLHFDGNNNLRSTKLYNESSFYAKVLFSPH